METRIATFAFHGGLVREEDPILWTCEILRGLFRTGWQIHILGSNIPKSKVKLFANRLGLPISDIHIVKAEEYAEKIVEVGSAIHIEWDDEVVAYLVDHGIPCIRVGPTA